MCITFLIQNQMQIGAEFPFVFAFNRDESIFRAAETIKFQAEKGYANIVCAIDI